MTDEKITRIGATLLGNDYQDIVALDLIIQFLEHPKDFEWIKVEAYDEAKFLDDIYVKKSNGKIIARQVKYATRPDDCWDWDDLLKKSESGSSLLQKWIESWQKISTHGEIEEIALWTNRDAGPKIKHSLEIDNKINKERIEKTVWKEIIKQCSNEDNVREFFSIFKFRFKEQGIDTLRQSVTRRLENLGVSPDGLVSLKETVRDWTIHKDKPLPDGKIWLKDIKVAALWYNLKQISQNFEIPDDYVLPTKDFHRNVLRNIESKKENIIVISAPPALGKSTYLSFLVKELKKKEIPVVRHHYYLSIRDKTPDRFDHRIIFGSLMKEIQNNYIEAIEDETRNPSPDLFLEWLKKCGEYYSKINKPFVVIIDGLDHVYREQNSIIELNKLFNQLLPVENRIVLIVGTQPIEDKNLPIKLLQIKPRDSWLDLPLFTRNAIEEWVIIHSEDISLNIKKDFILNNRLPSIVNAFYNISKGHPLVLKVSLKELLIRYNFITEYQIRNLTEHLNSRDINDYYKRLWLQIDTKSKFVLFLFTCCPFEWKKEEVLDVLSSSNERASYNDAFESIRQLLTNDFLGWCLYHKSFNIFVESTTEFLESKNFIFKKALDWIKKGHSKYLKWAYEWRLESKIGNTDPLINGPTRKWLIDSMVKLYPNEDILIILQQCGELSLKSKNFQRFVANGLIADYYLQGIEYENEGLKKLLFPRTFINKEEILRNKIRNYIDEMDDEELLDYARLQKELGNENLLFEIFEHLNDRLKFSEFPRNKESSFDIITRVAALSERVTVDRIIRYISSNRENHNNLRILKYFCSECVFSKIKSRILDLLEYKIDLTQNEIDIMGGYLALLCIEDRTDIVSVMSSMEIKNCFWIIYLYLNNKLKTTIDIEFPNLEVLNRLEYEHYKYRELIEDTFYMLFFVFLANKLQNQNQRNENFIIELGDYTWARQFIKKLYEYSEVVFTKLTNKQLIIYSEIYNCLNDLEKPDFYEARDDYEFGNGAGKALISIANELFRIVRFSNPNLKINKSELENVLSSDYVFPRIWIEKYLSYNRKYLDREGFEYLLKKTTEILNTTIEIFYEKAIDYALLARVSVIHDDENRCLEFINKSIDNTISYGGHKDLYFSGCLEVIKKLYRIGILETKDWLLSIIPPIININDYTDGKETRYTPEDLIDTLYLMDKNMFLDFYCWLLKREEYWYAQYAFHHYLINDDLSSYINKSIARTAIDNESLKILNAKAKSGNEEAEKIMVHFENLYGKYIPIEKEEKTYVPSFSTGTEKEGDIEYSKYPPEKFEELIKLFNNKSPYELRNPLNNWLRYWSSTPKAISAISKIEEFIKDDEDYKLSDQLFKLTRQYKGDGEAYPWLVKSFINNYNWQRYFVSGEMMRDYFFSVKEEYSTKWEQFICDTMIDKFSKKISIGTTSKYHYLIEFLIQMEQIELAKSIGEEVINFGLEIVSPLKFNKPSWILEYE